MIIEFELRGVVPQNATLHPFSEEGDLPNRILRDGILESERIDKIGPLSELFYRRLMSVVDDYGRYTAAVQVLLSRCFPTRPCWADAELVHTALHECEQAGLIRVYIVQEHKYLEMLNFRQQLRAKTSKFPSFEDGCVASANHVTSICDLSPPLSSRSPTSHSHSSPHTTPTPTPNFEAFWERYRKLRDAGRMQITAQMWISWDCDRHKDEIFQSLASYEASRDVANGAVQNGDLWLRTVHDGGWLVTWPALTTKKTRLEQIMDGL